MEFGEDFLKTFLEGSVDHIIYRVYIVNRRFFIYCSLACDWQSKFMQDEQCQGDAVISKNKCYMNNVNETGVLIAAP